MEGEPAQAPGQLRMPRCGLPAMGGGGAGVKGQKHSKELALGLSWEGGTGSVIPSAMNHVQSSLSSLGLSSTCPSVRIRLDNLQGPLDWGLHAGTAVLGDGKEWASRAGVERWAGVVRSPWKSEGRR